VDLLVGPADDLGGLDGPAVTQRVAGTLPPALDAGQAAERRSSAEAVGSTPAGTRFQVEGHLTSVMDEMQRQMRARFTERIAELQRTVAASAAALDKAAKREAAERRSRTAEVEAALAGIAAFEVQLRTVGA
jgi:hypothetical protein